MTTVPKADTPAPANNAKTTLVSDSMSHGYGRPTAGGNATGDAPAPAGNVMGGYSVPAPAPVSTGGTMAGPDFGHGATIVGPSADRPSGASDVSGGGTVGNSGPQGG